jgi:hypothetical protein
MGRSCTCVARGAQNRHGVMSELSPLCAQKRTWIYPQAVQSVRSRLKAAYLIPECKNPRLADFPPPSRSSDTSGLGRPCAPRPFLCAYLSVFPLRNKPWTDALSIIAITRPKEQTHETTFIDRICSLHFRARSNSVRVGNAGCNSECTSYRHRHLNHPSTRLRPWLGPSRGPRSSLRMGPRPSLWMEPSSPLVKPYCLVVIIHGRSRRSLAAFSFGPKVPRLRGHATRQKPPKQTSGSECSMSALPPENGTCATRSACPLSADFVAEVG